MTFKERLENKTFSFLFYSVSGIVLGALVGGFIWGPLGALIAVAGVGYAIYEAKQK